MKTSVIITCYNNEKYIKGAISSVLAQYVQPDEIIVVNDGSTDTSLDAISELSDNKLTIINQPNTGQMSAYNSGFSSANGDVFFFLDGDDQFCPSHIKDYLQIYENHPEIDFISGAFKFTGRKNHEVKIYPDDKFLGRSIISTYYGNPQLNIAFGSTGSIKRSLAKKVFPIPQELAELSKHHGDVPVIVGSSIFGASKYYKSTVQALYQVHEGSNSVKNRSNSHIYQEQQLISKAKQYYYQKSKLAPLFWKNVLIEFQTIEKPDKNDYKRYKKTISNLPISWLKKLALRWKLYSQY